jgi:hypothetical protein
MCCVTGVPIVLVFIYIHVYIFTHFYVDLRSSEITR